MNKHELFTRFDSVMAHLKPVEPSVSFDIEFKRRLQEAIAKESAETAFERFIRRTSEGLRYVLLPQTPVLARALATIVVCSALVAVGYGMQPSHPRAVSYEGIVLVQAARENTPHPMGLTYRCNTGDIIITKDGARLDIKLPDRYAIRIKGEAKLTIARLTPLYGKGKAIFELKHGKILVDIDQGFKGSRFIINTESASAKALGTKFSVDAPRKDASKTKVSVLEGTVEVKSRYKPYMLAKASDTVFVKAGQKTEVAAGEVPHAPQRLLEQEWLELEEIYQIGKKPLVMLLLKNTPDRVKQLLRPCPLYISDEKPRETPLLLEKALLKISEALEKKDKALHLESIKLLEKIVAEYPNPKYDAQLLLYIGSYYEYLSCHEEAIETFENMLKLYPDSPFASIAQCAIGLIYDEKLQSGDKARQAYALVLSKYPNSLEAIWVEEKLGIKKVSN